MVVFSLRHFAWIFHNHSSFQMGKQHLSKDNHGLIVDHLKSDSFRPNFRLTKERTVNTFCPVDFPPLDYEVARANIESSAGKVQSQMGFDVSFFIWVTFECFFGGLECVGKEMIKKNTLTKNPRGLKMKLSWVLLLWFDFSCPNSTKKRGPCWRSENSAVSSGVGWAKIIRLL